MRPCLRKLDPGFWTYGCVSFLVPIDLKLVHMPQTPEAIFFATWKVFPVKLNKILHKISPYFWKLDDFLQSYEGHLYPENYKKNIKNYVFGAIPTVKFPFNCCPQNPPFLKL